MATKITTGLIDSGAITSALITDASITADDLHTTLDLTGKTVTVATASAGDNDTSVASTAFVSTAIANLADSAPSTLDTLNELAAALGDDANYATTTTNAIAAKLPLAGGTMTGDLNLAVTDKVDFGGGIGEYASSPTAGIVGFTSRGSVGLFTDSNNNGSATGDALVVYDGAEYGGSTKTLLKVTKGNDISFYEDTGTTAKLFWDASAESLGIGTTSPAAPLHVNISGAGDAVKIQGNSITDFDFVGNPPEFNLEDIGSSTNTKRARITVDSNKISIQGLGDDDATLNHTFFSGDLSNGNVTLSDYVQLGSIGTSTSSATPAELNLGSLYADSAGSAAKAKLKIYEDSVGYVYGLGVSSGTFETHLSYPTGKYDWYIGTNKKMSITHDGIIDLKTNNTGALAVPNGTTAQRPTAAAGMIRYNTTNSVLEGYIDSGWKPIKAGTPSLTSIGGLQVWADVTAGISSSAVSDLSGNNNNGTLASTSAKGTLAGNTYFEAFGSNYIEYAATVLPNSPWSGSNACSYFFVCTNKKTNNSYATYIAQLSSAVSYQIIRHTGASTNYNVYAEHISDWQVTATNAVPVNSTISEAYIIIFQFNAPSSNSQVEIFKRENGSTTTETHALAGNNKSFQWTANGQATRIGTSSWGNEYLDAGIFAWGFTNTAMSSADRQIIYDYYADKGLAN